MPRRPLVMARRDDPALRKSITCLPNTRRIRRPRCTAAASGSSYGEEACGLFGELLRKLEVRAVPGIRVDDQPGIR